MFAEEPAAPEPAAAPTAPEPPSLGPAIPPPASARQQRTVATPAPAPMPAPAAAPSRVAPQTPWGESVPTQLPTQAAQPAPAGAASVAATQKGAGPEAWGDPVMQTAPLSPDPGVRTLGFVGFRMQPAAARVYIKLDGVGRFSIAKESARKVVIELSNTKVVSRKHLRPLYTNFFPGSAVEVVETRKEGATRTRIEITLRADVSFAYGQVGDVIYVDFPLVAAGQRG